MELITGKIVDLPTPIRHKTNKLEGTSVWAQAMAKMRDGLRPHEEGFAITFTPEDGTKLGVKTIDRVFANMCRKFIKGADLSYEVTRYKDINGNAVVRVTGSTVVARSKSNKGHARKAS